MTINIYTHQKADAQLPGEIVQQVVDVIQGCPQPIRALGATTVKKALLNELHNLGWSGETKLDASSNITITSLKNKVGLCLQTGNMGRMYADLLKLQTLYLKGQIMGGIMILPTREAAKRLGQNIANSHRLEKELMIFSSVITLPLVIMGFSE